MTPEFAGKIILTIDAVAIIGLIVFAWLDLRRQTTDAGKVGGVIVLAALCYVLTYVGRALLEL